MTSTLWMLLPYASFAPKHARMHAVPAVVVNLLYTKSYHHQTTFALHKTRLHSWNRAQANSTYRASHLFFFVIHPTGQKRRLFIIFLNMQIAIRKRGWCGGVRDHPEWLTDSACPSRRTWTEMEKQRSSPWPSPSAIQAGLVPTAAWVISVRGDLIRFY
jgi:hypothetical protein